MEQFADGVGHIRLGAGEEEGVADLRKGRVIRGLDFIDVLGGKVFPARRAVTKGVKAHALADEGGSDGVGKNISGSRPKFGKLAGEEGGARDDGVDPGIEPWVVKEKAEGDARWFFREALAPVGDALACRGVFLEDEAQGAG